MSILNTVLNTPESIDCCFEVPMHSFTMIYFVFSSRPHITVYLLYTNWAPVTGQTQRIVVEKYKSKIHNVRRHDVVKAYWLVFLIGFLGITGDVWQCNYLVCKLIVLLFVSPHSNHIFPLHVSIVQMRGKCFGGRTVWRNFKTSLNCFSSHSPDLIHHNIWHLKFVWRMWVV